MLSWIDINRWGTFLCYLCCNVRARTCGELKDRAYLEIVSTKWIIHVTYEIDIIKCRVSWCRLVVCLCGVLVYICGDKFIILWLSAVCHCLHTLKAAATTGLWQICVVRKTLREKDGSPQGTLTLNDLVSSDARTQKIAAVFHYAHTAVYMLRSQSIMRFLFDL